MQRWEEKLLCEEVNICTCPPYYYIYYFYISANIELVNKKILRRYSELIHFIFCMRIPCELCNTTTAYYMVQKLFTRFYVSECSFILHDPNNFYSQCLSSIGMLHSFDVLLAFEWNSQRWFYLLFRNPNQTNQTYHHQPTNPFLRVILFKRGFYEKILFSA